MAAMKRGNVFALLWRCAEYFSKVVELGFYPAYVGPEGINPSILVVPSNDGAQGCR